VSIPIAHAIPAVCSVDLAEGTVIQELFARYLEDGATLSRVVAAFAQQGIPTPHGRRHWSRSTLRWMLSNPVYLGQVYANRTHARPARQRHSALQSVGRQGTTLELTARTAVAVGDDHSAARLAGAV
jgi:site-specific DNA recombinase